MSNVHTPSSQSCDRWNEEHKVLFLEKKGTRSGTLVFSPKSAWLYWNLRKSAGSAARTQELKSGLCC